MTAQTTASQLLGTAMGAAVGPLLGSNMYAIMSEAERVVAWCFMVWVKHVTTGAYPRIDLDTVGYCMVLCVCVCVS